MELMSFQFIVFVAIGLIVYYICPKKFQWIVLLAMSITFYAFSGISTMWYIAISIFTMWGATLLISGIGKTAKEAMKAAGRDIPQRKAIKKKADKKKKLLLWGAIVVNIGILFVMKYYSQIAEGLSTESFRLPQLSGLIMPLGLSFYTFQSVGYLLDVYWEKVEPEKNIAKYALFISFFPQLIQGPIARFDQLQNQLTEGHSFDTDAIRKGLLLVFWGLLKKLVIANRLTELIAGVFDNPTEQSGCMIIVALLAYSIQQYADFSGGIDLITGVAEMFGIRMAENFRRPYFSQSLSEFWRRWHISLGGWMRDYVFYPMAMTKGIDRFCKLFSKSKKYGAKAYAWAQMFICNVTVFLLVGVWHGAQWNYVVWGLYNGVVIAIESIIKSVNEPKRLEKGLGEYPLWRQILNIIGTFLIVNFGWIFDRSITLQNAGIVLKNLFTRFGLSSFSLSLLSGYGMHQKDYFIVAIGVAVLFAVSLIQELKGVCVRECLLKKPVALRWVAIYVMVFAVIAFAYNPEGASTFAYAVF